MDLPTLANNARTELLDEVIPFWLQHGVDSDHGGFICGLSHKGNVVDASKYAWYQGRGAWIFAKMYQRTNNLEHLRVARQALQFVAQHCQHGDEFWTIVGRDGAVLKDRSKTDTVGYASLFYAEGMQQVALHEKDEHKRSEMLQTTTQLCKNFLARCNKQRNAPETAYLLSAPYQKGTRTLGHQMIPLRLATQVLSNHSGVLTEEQRLYFEDVAQQMVQNITVKFYDLEAKLTREELSFDFSPLRDPVLYYLGHAIEAFWFVLVEAERIGDSVLLELACDRIQRHVECAWDPVYGGLNRGLTLCGTQADHHDDTQADTISKEQTKMKYNDKNLMDKVAWVEQEGLIALLMVRERSQRAEMVAWAQMWFAKLHAWTMEHFPLKKHGHKLWLVGGDRLASFEENYTFGNAGLKSRKENYHHPRYLMAVVEEHERKSATTTISSNEEQQRPSGSLFIFIFVVLIFSVLYDLLFKNPPPPRIDG